MKVAIVGAGAAGCFCAIELGRRLPSASIDIFESGRKPLAKVAITGGGRCNLTNSFEGISSLNEAYPRGDKLMRKVFSTFDYKDTWDWFVNEGVELVLQENIDKLGWKHTNRFSPGYCGWHVAQQQMLFPLFDSHTCGVQLTDSSLMIPIKSVSGIMGVGREVRKLDYTCGLCTFEKCYKRKKR